MDLHSHNNVTGGTASTLHLSHSITNAGGGVPAATSTGSLLTAAEQRAKLRDYLDSNSSPTTLSIATGGGGGGGTRTSSRLSSVVSPSPTSHYRSLLKEKAPHLLPTLETNSSNNNNMNTTSSNLSSSSSAMGGAGNSRVPFIPPPPALPISGSNAPSRASPTHAASLLKTNTKRFLTELEDHMHSGKACDAATLRRLMHDKSAEMQIGEGLPTRLKAFKEVVAEYARQYGQLGDILRVVCDEYESYIRSIMVEYEQRPAAATVEALTKACADYKNLRHEHVSVKEQNIHLHTQVEQLTKERADLVAAINILKVKTDSVAQMLEVAQRMLPAKKPLPHHYLVSATGSLNSSNSNSINTGSAPVSGGRRGSKALTDFVTEQVALFESIMADYTTVKHASQHFQHLIASSKQQEMENVRTISELTSQLRDTEQLYEKQYQICQAMQAASDEIRKREVECEATERKFQASEALLSLSCRENVQLRREVELCHSLLIPSPPPGGAISVCKTTSTDIALSFAHALSVNKTQKDFVLLTTTDPRRPVPPHLAAPLTSKTEKATVKSKPMQRSETLQIIQEVYSQWKIAPHQFSQGTTTPTPPSTAGGPAARRSAGKGPHVSIVANNGSTISNPFAEFVLKIMRKGVNSDTAATEQCYALIHSCYDLVNSEHGHPLAEEFIRVCEGTLPVELHYAVDDYLAAIKVMCANEVGECGMDDAIDAVERLSKITEGPIPARTPLSPSVEQQLGKIDFNPSWLRSLDVTLLKRSLKTVFDAIAPQKTVDTAQLIKNDSPFNNVVRRVFLLCYDSVALVSERELTQVIVEAKNSNEVVPSEAAAMEGTVEGMLNGSLTIQSQYSAPCLKQLCHKIVQCVSHHYHQLVAGNSSSSAAQKFVPMGEALSAIRRATAAVYPAAIAGTATGSPL